MCLLKSGGLRNADRLVFLQLIISIVVSTIFIFFKTSEKEESKKRSEAVARPKK